MMIINSKVEIIRLLITGPVSLLQIEVSECLIKYPLSLKQLTISILCKSLCEWNNILLSISCVEFVKTNVSQIGIIGKGKDVLVVLKVSISFCKNILLWKWTLKDKRYLKTWSIIFWEYKWATKNNLFEVVMQLTSKRYLLFFSFGLYNRSVL